MIRLLSMVPSHLLRMRASFSVKKGQSDIRDVLKKYSQDLNDSGIMQAMIPRHFSEETLLKLSPNQRFTAGKNPLLSLNASLGDPIWDLLDRGGKRWRPTLAMLIAQLLGKSRQSVLEVAALCEIVHNGTLLVDDIQDSSTVRRDKPCVHLLFGEDVAINSGNFMFFAPMLMVFKKFEGKIKERLTSIYLEEMTQVHFGQALDIIWHRKGPHAIEKITEEDYLQMCAHKTGCLARMAARMACAVCEATPQDQIFLSRYVETLGVAFQIQDDLLNLEGEEFLKTKGYNGQDIHQGKVTLLVIHCLKHSSPEEASTLIDILSQKITDQALISKAIGILRKTGSLEYGRQRMKQLIADSDSQLETHFSGRGEEEPFRLLRQLATFGISRST